MGIITGIIAGTVSALGMGGGTILILVLVNFMNVEQHVAQATNLVFFIPTAIISTIINYKQKIINIKLGTLIAICGVIGAIIGATISLRTNSAYLKKYFGIFLIIIAIYEIYNIYKEYKNRHKANNTNDKKYNEEA